MAYPVVSNPYGFRPVNRIDGLPYAGAFRQLPIGAAYNTAIYYGDPVAIVTGGTIAKSSTSASEITSAVIAGIFVGCQKFPLSIAQSLLDAVKKIEGR